MNWLIVLGTILSKLPWERIVAWILTKLLAKAQKTPEKLAECQKTAERIHEAATVAHSLLNDAAAHVKLAAEVAADGKITDDEVKRIGAAALDAWAEAKDTPARFKEAWRKR